MFEVIFMLNKNKIFYKPARRNFVSQREILCLNEKILCFTEEILCINGKNDRFTEDNRSTNAKFVEI